MANPVGYNLGDIRKAVNKTAQTVDNLILENGDSSPEVVAARTDANGNTYSTLGARVDAEEKKIESKADAVDVRRKDTKIELTDLSSDTLGAMSGQATFNLLSIPQDNSVTAKKIDSLLADNLNTPKKVLSLELGTISGSTGQDSSAQTNTRLRSTFIKNSIGDYVRFKLSGFSATLYIYNPDKTLKGSSVMPESGVYKFASDGYYRLVILSTQSDIDMTPHIRSVTEAIEAFDMGFNRTLIEFGVDTGEPLNKYITTGKNLFNLDKSVIGYLDNSGAINTSSQTYETSDFIATTASTSYVSKYTRKVAVYTIYKELKEVIDVPSNGQYIITPSEDGYIRVSYPVSEKLDMQVEKGETSTPTEPYYTEFTYSNPDNTDQKNPLFGKSLLDLGDSIAFGAYNNYVGYSDIIANRNGMALYKYSQSGSTVADVSASDPTRSNLQQKIEQFLSQNNSVSPDYILIEGGTNDVLYSTLGSITSGYSDELDRTTYFGGLEYIVKDLKTRFPAAKIAFITAHKMSSRNQVTQGRYHDAAIEVMKKWSVPVVDLYSYGGLNTFIDVMKNMYTDTGTHPNEAGYELFYVPHIEETLKKL
ncbi:SGNH/GDSL hydrolase family protein [Terribacillus saccharophilus]|uniref:SGNH/GDSL hydrolase family protein n=1 Tax=Terribacillus saccharophilus TaxID=361277 RepID=UPI003982C316